MPSDSKITPNEVEGKLGFDDRQAAGDMAIADDQPIDFVTLGMFIIDDIDLPPPLPPVKDIMGGAGTFAVIGARLFSPPPEYSRTVGWIIDRGNDFPSSMTEQIRSWSTSALMRDTPDRATTKGWNGYGKSFEDANRAFKYLTPKKRLTAADLTPPLLASKSFHLICGPSRCKELVHEIHHRRRNLEQEDLGKPVIIWEPVPDLCTPEELLNLTNCLPLVDICSPNHAELASLMGDENDGLTPEGEIDTRAVERSVEQLLAAMPLQSYTLVVRCGGKGCYVARNGGRRRVVGQKKRKKRPAAQLHGGLQPDTDMMSLFAGLMQDENGSVAREEIEIDPGVEKWIPAYYQAGEAAVDGVGGPDEVVLEGLSENSKEASAVKAEASEESGQKTDETVSRPIPDESPFDPTSSEPAQHDETAENSSAGEPVESIATEVTAPSPTASPRTATTASKKVIDPTGGGNTFMGALAVALARGKCIEEAAVWGSIAASFAIEQVGLPIIGVDEEGEETWNGVRVQDRLHEFQERIGMT